MTAGLSGWTMATLGQLVASMSNGLPGTQNREGRGIPVSRIETIADQKINFSRIGFIEEYDDAVLPRYRLQSGDILFSHINSPAHIGKTAIFTGEKTLFHGINLLRVQVNQNVCEPRLFNYACKLLRANGSFSLNAQHAVNQSSLNQTKIAAFQIPLAPREEQKRIADKLDTVLTRVDAVNTRLARVSPLLKRFRQSVLAAATSGRLTEDWRAAQSFLANSEELVAFLAADHDEIGGHARGNASEPTKEAHDLSSDQLPDGWRVSTLKDCCTPGRPICYGILKPGPELEEGVPYIRVADFPGNRLSLTGIKRTSPEIDLQFKRARLKAGDLLLSIRGSVGRLIEIPTVLDGANITQDTARLSISRRLKSKYIYFALLAPDTQRRMTNAIRGVAVRGINIGDVRALQIPIPTSVEQAEIVRRVETLFAFADRLEARLQTAQAAADRLTPSLLAKAFRGELVPQDPSDEPASELLKRLAASTPVSPTKRGRAKSTKAV
jgi:type I restriction enzyme, S subunit